VCVIVIQQFLACDVEEVDEARVVAGDEPIDSVLGGVEVVDAVLVDVVIKTARQYMRVAVVQQYVAFDVGADDVAVGDERDGVEVLFVSPVAH